MQASFWHQKWEKGETGFHESEPNPLLRAHIARLQLKAGDRVFLPLCGKTLDIGWLLAQGQRVAGIELSELAIQELFTELNIQPTLTIEGNLKHYSAEHLDIFVGDIFELSAQQLGPVSAIYDRAALVALPAETRQQYAAHLLQISEQAPQLLVTFAYDSSLKAGPPFSVEAAELEELYGSSYSLTSLESNPVEQGRLGNVEAIETVWLLQKSS